MDNSSSAALFEADYDKSQLPPIDQKRLVAFVNHFLIDTAKFLNSFVVNCEEKFVTLESKLQKINAELVVIESKIFQGELKNPVVERNSEETKDEVDESMDDEKVITSDSQPSNENTTNIDDEVLPIVTETGVKVCEDVRYEKYFKMKQFGVPAEAIKLKMSIEGLDSSLLDQPDRILEDGVKKTIVEESD